MLKAKSRRHSIDGIGYFRQEGDGYAALPCFLEIFEDPFIREGRLLADLEEDNLFELGKEFFGLLEKLKCALRLATR